ncbi:LacI family DNA-binding transcriptional regulator [Phytohabitans flavus]|uniref:LacI family DNA-binding transcriptional regulator n=1 Tax=Phytohabitans flavus TaxID=1076124 RepID=UPI0031F12F32
MPQRERVTLAEIARTAGVSIATVSRVLNGHTEVSESTRVVVQRLLEEQGYRRRTTHRRDQRGLIELVISEVDCGWCLGVMAGVEEIAATAGYGVVLSTVQQRSDSLPVSGSQGVILVVCGLTGEQRAELDRRKVPYVVVDGVSHPPVDVPSVGVTDWAGGYSATQHLIELGHRRIAAIGGPEQLLCTRARVAGYRAALRAAGLPLDGELVRYAEFRHDGGLEAARSLLELADPPTAVFAGNDEQATGVLEAVRQRELRVPGDISVVGFDDRSFAQWTAPPLTTVRQPLHEMGAAAVRTLLRLVEGQRPDVPRIELATQLVVRQSTSAAAA